MRNILLAVSACLFSLSASAQCDANFTESYTSAPLVLHFQNDCIPISPTTPYRVDMNINYGTGGGYVVFPDYGTNYTFPNKGYYDVKVTVALYDSNALAYTCLDTLTKHMYVDIPNTISGYVETNPNIVSNPSLKVWLITYDSTTNVIRAVDSVATSGQQATYIFSNHPAGKYRIKAALTNGATTGTGHVPTYSDSSINWSTAKLIAHLGAMTANKVIYMMNGMVTTGPGFISGNVLLGAGKGTATGVVNQTVYLVNANGQLVYTAKTDANGAFSFSNLPYGSYKIHPEEMGFATTDGGAIINSFNETVTGITFEKNMGAKTIVLIPAGVDDVITKKGFDIYPNPNNGLVTIAWAKNIATEASITVTDVAGRVVNTQTVNTKSGTTQLNLLQLQAGQYFISVNAGQISATKQIAIIK